MSRSASKSKKHVELAKSIPTKLEAELRFPAMSENISSTKYRFATVGDLGADGNPGAILPCRVVMHLDKPNQVPITFLVVDSAQNFFTVSFYQASQDIKTNLQPGDLLHVKNPELIFTSLDFKGEAVPLQLREDRKYDRGSAQQRDHDWQLHH